MGTGRHRVSIYIDVYLLIPSHLPGMRLSIIRSETHYCVLVESNLALLLLAALLRAFTFKAKSLLSLTLSYVEAELSSV